MYMHERICYLAVTGVTLPNVFLFQMKENFLAKNLCVNDSGNRYRRYSTYKALNNNYK